MPDSAKQIIAYYETLASHRSDFEHIWQEVADHSIGRRDFTVRRRPGRQRTTSIYDTTSRDAHTMLVAALHALLTNPATNWIGMRWENDILNEIDEAVYYLDAVRARVQTSFNRHAAGFATHMSEVYDDLIGFGNGAMFVKEDVRRGAIFVSRPLSQIYIDEDDDGSIRASFRSFKLKAWQAIAEFGDATPPKVKRQNEQNPNTEFTFLHHIRKRGTPIPGNIDASGMECESIYLMLDDKSVVGKPSGYRENPLLVGRWKVDTGEVYGRGPAVDALPDQKMLNAISRTYIRAAEKAAEPPLLVDDDGVLPGSNTRVTPNSKIVTRNDGTAREPVRYLESRSQLQWPERLIEVKSKRIEKHFHSEIIQAFQDPRMSATQVIELARLSQRILSPVLGRIQTDLLDPMVKRVYGIESRRADFPVPPDFLRGQSFKIEYVSPVARAQKAQEAQAILDTFAAVAAMREVDPSVDDNMDYDESFRRIAEANGVPVGVVRPQKDVQARRQAEAKLAAEQAQQQQMMMAAESASKLLPGIAKLSEQQMMQ